MSGLLDPLRIGAGSPWDEEEPEERYSSPQSSSYDPFNFDSLIGSIDSAWDQRKAEKRAQIQWDLEHGTRQYDQIMSGMQGPETMGEVVTEGILGPLGGLGAAAWEGGRRGIAGLGRGLEGLGEMIQAPGQRLADVSRGTPFEFLGGAPQVLTDPIGEIVGAAAQPMGQLIQEGPFGDPTSPEMAGILEQASDAGPIARYGMDVAGQIPQFGAMLAGTAAGVPPVGIASALGLSSAGSEMEQAEAQGVSPEDVALRGVIAGGSEFAGETLGTLKSLERVFGPEASAMAQSAMRQIGASMGREATEEFATSLAQQAGEAMTGGEVPTISQLFGRALYEAGVAAPLGGVTTGAGMALAGDIGALDQEADAQAALEAQAFLEAQAQPAPAVQDPMLAPVPEMPLPDVPVEAAAPPAPSLPSAPEPEPVLPLPEEPFLEPIPELPAPDVAAVPPGGGGPAGPPVAPTLRPELRAELREGGRLPDPVPDGGEPRVSEEGVPLPPVGGGLYRGQRVGDPLLGTEDWRSGPVGAIPTTSDISLANEFYDPSQDTELVELAANAKNPFSFEHAYPAERFAAIPGFVEKAKAKGRIGKNGKVSAWDVAATIHDDYFDQRPELSRTDRVAFRKAFAVTREAIRAAGFDSTFQMHQKADKTYAPEWGFFGKEGSTEPVVQVKKRIAGPKVAEPEVLEEEVGVEALAAPAAARRKAPAPVPQRVLTQIPEKKAPGVAEDVTSVGDEKLAAFDVERGARKGESRSVQVGDRTLHPTPLPEILEVAKEGLGGLPVEVKEKLQKGMLAGFWRGGDKGTVRVLAKQGGEAQQLAATVAHEFGHALDYFPDQTMGRGNVLGRLVSGFKDMRTEFVSKGNTIPTKELRSELIALSDAWRPGLKQATGKQKSYRMRGTELYADFVSALLRRPDMVSKLAPRSLDIFLDHLGKKGDFDKAWSEIQGRIGEGESAVMEHRRAADVEMFKKGREKRFASLKPEKTGAAEAIVGAKEGLSRAFVDAFADIYRIAGKAGEKVKGPLGDAIRAIQESRYSSSAQSAYVEDAQKTIKNFMDRSDVGWDDLGLYLFYRRAGAEDRAKIAPGARSYVDYEKLVQDWGKQKVADVERFVADWHALRRQQVLDPAIASGIASEPLAKKMVENPGYVRFFVQEFMEDDKNSLIVQSLGLQPFKKRVGTFKDIGDPVLETILGDLAIVRLADANRAAEKSVTALSRIPGVVSEVKKGKFVSKDPKQGEIHFLKDGVLHTAAVPKGIADGFAKGDGTGEAWAGFDAVHNVVRSVILTYNPAWAVRNVFRDVRQFRRNVMGSKEFAGAYSSELARYVEGVLTPFAAFKWWARGAKIARKEIKTGKKSEIRQEMLKNRALLATKDVAAISETEQRGDDILPIELLSNVFNPDQADAAKGRSAFGKMIHAAGKALRHFGEVSELGTKYGGYMYLKEMQRRMKGNLSDERISQLTRTQVGTPDVRRRGSAHGLLNRVFMFANVGKEGWRASGEAAASDPALYATKLVANTVLPKVLLSMAAKGLLDDDDDEVGKRTSDILRKIPDYRKRYFDVIPLFVDDNGKAWYISLPKDHLSMAVGGYIWSALGGGDRDFDSEDVRKAALQMVNDIPWSPANVHPVIEAFTSPAMTAAGISPTDYFKGRPVVPDYVMKEGGPEALKRVGSHIYESLGGSVLSNLRPPNTNDEGIVAWLESLFKPDLTTAKGVYDWATSVPVVGGALRSMLYASDYGDYEALSEIDRETERASMRRGSAREAIMLEELQKAEPDFDSAWERMKAAGVESKRYGDAKRQYQKLSLLKRKASLSSAQRFAVKSTSKEVEQKALEELGFDLKAIEESVGEDAP